MSTVHTYYEHVPGFPKPDKILYLWRRSWEDNGWTTRVLSEKDAASHPGYTYFLDRIIRFPTTNPKEYERACFLRHLAMANIGGGLLADYDVFNVAMPVDVGHERLKALALALGDAKLAILEPTKVPCLVWGTAEGYEDLCDLLCEYSVNGEKHVSDMTIIRKSQLPAYPVCVEHLCSGAPIANNPGSGWRDAGVIHFSNYSFAKLGKKGDKADLILEVVKHLH